MGTKTREKKERNQKLYEFWKRNYPDLSYEEIGLVFKLDRPRVWRIVQYMIKQKGKE
jgi:hypothetical protein